MTDIRALLAETANANTGGRKTPVFDQVGVHTVALKKAEITYKPKDLQKREHIFNTDLVVVASGSIQPGTVKGIGYFIASGAWPIYAQQRMREFTEALAAGIGDSRKNDEFNLDLLSDAQPGKGIVVRVEISPEMDELGNPKKSAKGHPIMQYAWSPVPQTAAEVKAMRHAIETGTVVRATAPAAEVPAAVAPATEEKKSVLGIKK